jgi:hypothetical protein
MLRISHLFQDKIDEQISMIQCECGNYRSIRINTIPRARSSGSIKVSGERLCGRLYDPEFRPSRLQNDIADIPAGMTIA